MSLKNLIANIEKLELQVTELKQQLEKCNEPKYLSGVSQVKYLVGTIDDVTRHVYLFYDYHDTKGECNSTKKHIMLNEWLDKLFKKEDRKFIDFYVEDFIWDYNDDHRKNVLRKMDESIRAVHGGKKDQLTIIRDTITANCIVPNKECPYNNIRIHYTDYRWFTKFDYIYYNNNQEYFKKLIQPYENEYYQTNITEFICEFIKNNINKIPKIKKQWNTLSFDKYFHKYMKAYLRLSRHYIKTFDNELKEMLKGNYDIIFLHSNLIASRGGDLFIPFMDLYLLGRLFKKFDVKNKKHPEYAKYNIIYAGKFHSEIYDEFLRSIGFKEKFSATSINKDNFQCVDISNMPNIFLDKTIE